jgi:amino acid adenylation domain-containing protein
MSDSLKDISALSPEKRTLLARFLKKEGIDLRSSLAIPKRPQAAQCPLSYGQQRLWFMQQLEPGSCAYNLPAAVRLKGELNIGALQASLDHIVSRHESLRTVFSEVDGQPVQKIKEAWGVEMPVIDVSSMPEEWKQEEVIRIARREAETAFDLSVGPMMRAKLVKVDDEEHVLNLTLHHIVTDGWSMGVMIEEMVKLYEGYERGEEVELEELAIQYGDYAVWQREWLKGEELEEHLKYWKEKLEGAPEVLELRKRRGRAREGERGGRKKKRLSEGLSKEIKEVSRQARVTMYMMLLGAFKVLMSRYTGQEDIVVGTPIAGRERVETERVIGIFVNTVVIRSEVRGDRSYREVLRGVREAVLEAQSHQEMPFEKIVEAMRPERSLSHSPLFQVMFDQAVTRSELPSLSSLNATYLDINFASAKFDLRMSVAKEGTALVASMEYDQELFDEPTIERMLNHYEILLESIVNDPDCLVSELSLLTGVEEQQILGEWNDTVREYERGRCIQEVIKEQALLHPDAIAVSYEEEQISYDELNRRANKVGRYLRKRGVGADDVVGVCLERSIDLVVSVVGVLKAGAAYMPMEVSYPESRLEMMMKDGGCRVVISSSREKEKVGVEDVEVIEIDREAKEIERESGEELERGAGEDNLAYVIFTSGSTGRPKGVLGTHRAAMNRFNWMWERYPLEPSDVCVQKTSLSFVDSVWEIFGPLLRGIRLVILSDDVIRDPVRLIESLIDNQITRIVLVPSLLRVLLESFPDIGTKLALLKYCITSGEALPGDLASQFLREMPNTRLLNLYGSSEVSADATWYEIRDEMPFVQIGRPINNLQVYLLDRYLHPVPVGVVGELHIAGEGLARGYIGHGDLTAARFIPNPFGGASGGQLYRTGDLGSYLPDGNIEFLGRTDHQIKIRGFRIELEEIENILREHPAVQNAIGAVRGDGTDNKRIVAYFVAAPDEPISSVDLIHYLKGRLPSYMIPAAIFRLDALPLTPSGKVDRRALPEPNAVESLRGITSGKPQLPVEMELAEIWKELLQLEEIGVEDDFFELGGHSLLALQLSSRVRKRFIVDFDLRSLFISPSLEKMAERIEESIIEKANPVWMDSMFDWLEGMDEVTAQSMLDLHTAPSAA